MVMSNGKYMDLDKVYKLLNNLCEDRRIALEERIELKRFVQKISESSSFLSIINQAFSNNERLKFSDNIKKAFTGNVKITRNFIIRYLSRKKHWCLYFVDDLGNESVFLDELDWNLVKSILTDLNVAFLIKAKRDETKE